MLGVSVDGREHVVESGVDPPAEPRARVCLATSGFSVELGELELAPPHRVGAEAWDAPLVLPGRARWEAVDAHALPDGSFAAEGPGSLLCRSVAPLEVARLRLRLRAFKAVGPELWERVEQSYRNVLDLEGLERARERTRIGGCELAGSELGTPDWELEAWTARCERLIAGGAEVGALEQLVAAAPDPFTALPLLPKSMIVRHRYGQARRGALELLAELEAARGDEAGELAALEQLVALEPQDWRHRSRLAQAARRAGRDERAVEAFGAVLALRPDRLPALEALCALLAGPDRHERLASAVSAYLDAAAGGASEPLSAAVWKAVDESYRAAGDLAGLEQLRTRAGAGSANAEGGE